MTEEPPPAKPDIEGRADLERIVNHFYGAVRSDSLLGFIFEDVAKVDWESHLPKMYAFWEKVLFGTGPFRGNPLGVHAGLVSLTEMGWPQFQQWLHLFQQTVDELYEGDRASHLKRCAEDMAHVIYSRINGVPDPRFDPANLTPEQHARYHRYREAGEGTHPPA